MEYRQGSIGRVFFVKAEHGDDLLGELKQLAVKEKIECAVFALIGALKEAFVVVGPRKDVVPPEPLGTRLERAHEIIGMGTLLKDQTGTPSIHLHASMGRGYDVITGCIRAETETYLVLEVIILEVEGVNAARTLDKLTGMHMLNFLK